MSDKISVIGLGKLGLPLAACLSARGYRVFGLDKSSERIESLKSKDLVLGEPGLKELLEESALDFTTDYKKALGGAGLVFVVLPTPSKVDHTFTNEFLLSACSELARYLELGATVVITSTVMPGSCLGEIKDTLEQGSGMKLGEGFGLCYNPAFIALGSVVRDYLEPDFVLIGSSDPASADKLEDIYKAVCQTNPPIARMNLVNAELVKLALNSFVTMKISFANTLAQICDELPGANVDAVTAALGLDSRIGEKYLKGSTSFGGPCFPRDSQAFGALAKNLSVKAPLAKATTEVNLAQRVHLRNLVLEKAGETVGILGLSYKPGTPVVEQSAGLHLAKDLLAAGKKVVLYDPVAAELAANELEWNVEVAKSLDELPETVVIATPDLEFKKLKGPKVIVDCWRILDASSLDSDVEYVPLGKGL